MVRLKRKSRLTCITNDLSLAILRVYQTQLLLLSLQTSKLSAYYNIAMVMALYSLARALVMCALLAIGGFSFNRNPYKQSPMPSEPYANDERAMANKISGSLYKTRLPWLLDYALFSITVTVLFYVYFRASSQHQQAAVDLKYLLLVAFHSFALEEGYKFMVVRRLSQRNDVTSLISPGNEIIYIIKEMCYVRLA